MAKKKGTQSDFDGAWKEGFKRHFRSFLEAFFPRIAREIDWSVPPVWLDKELERIISRTGSKGNRVDLLARMVLKDGTEQIFLCHVEIQSTKEEHFEHRLHRYWAGLYFHSGENVVTLAVLADLNSNWHPTSSKFELGGFKSEIIFEVCKLLDLPLNEKGKTHGLPYEVARAQLDALRTTGDPEGRYRAKKALLLNLYKCGYTADDVREIYWLIDQMMTLNETFALRLNNDIKTYEEENAMPYVTTIERAGIEQGIEKGIEQGIEKGIEEGIEKGIEEGIAIRDREFVTALIKDGFSVEKITELTKLSAAQIDQILENKDESES